MLIFVIFDMRSSLNVQNKILGPCVNGMFIGSKMAKRRQHHSFINFISLTKITN